MAEKVKRKRKMKGQQGLYFEATEGLQLLKSADVARAVKVVVHRYKGKDFFGLHVNGACVAKGIPEAVAIAGKKMFEDARDNWALTLAHQGKEVLDKLVPNLVEQIKPTKREGSVANEKEVKPKGQEDS